MVIEEMGTSQCGPVQFEGHWQTPFKLQLPPLEQGGSHSTVRRIF